MTTRQALMGTVVRKIYTRNYEAWRLEIGDPLKSTEKQMAEVAKRGGNLELTTYGKHNIYSEGFQNSVHGLIEGSLYIEAAKNYYMNMSDKAFNRFVNEALRKAQRQLEGAQLAYEYSQQEASEVESSEPDYGQLYLNEIAEVLADNSYFDTPIKKASRIAFLTKSWGAVSAFLGQHQYCDECDKRHNPEDLHTDGYRYSRLLCDTCR